MRHVHFGIGSLALQRALRNRIAQAQGAEYRRAAGCRDFAGEVKGVDLRSTAGKCAWVRTPQVALTTLGSPVRWCVWRRTRWTLFRLVCCLARWDFHALKILFARRNFFIISCVWGVCLEPPVTLAGVSRAGARTGLQPPGHGDMQGFNSSSLAFCCDSILRAPLCKCLWAERIRNDSIAKR